MNHEDWIQESTMSKDVDAERTVRTESLALQVREQSDLELHQTKFKIVLTTSD